MPWIVDWKITVDGQDMSAAMKPYLIDVEVTDKEGTASDTCSLTLDDTGGQIRLPKEGAAVTVALMGATVFAGIVDTVRSTGTRGGGQLLLVSAKGFDSRGKVKEGQSFHKDDATLDQFLAEAARAAGFSIVIDEVLGRIRRDYWAAEGESFLALGQRIAREINGTFKLRGTQAVLMRRGANPLAPVTARTGAGGNLISWDIAPFTGRRSFTRAKVQYFDRKKAEFRQEELEIETDRDLPEATNVIRSTAGDKDQAKDIAEARKREAEREGGEGTVVLDLTPSAQAEAMLTLTGTRPGVDGSYRIVTVTHRADRSGGATTSLELKQPTGDAGKDQR